MSIHWTAYSVCVFNILKVLQETTEQVFYI